MKKSYLLIGVILLLYNLVAFYFMNQISYLIGISMPFREMYYPTLGTLFIYIIPFSMGMLLNRYKFNNSKSLLIGTVLMIPFMVKLINSSDIFTSLTISYYIMLVPILVSLGNIFSSKKFTESNLEHNSEKKWNYFLVLIIIFVFLMNLLPYILSGGSVVGSDIHYHIGLTNKISEGKYFQNPYFLEEYNTYPQLIHLTISVLSRITGMGIIDAWMLYVSFTSALFFLMFYILIKLLFKSNKIAAVSCLLTLSWNQIMFPDVSTHLAGWLFLITGLIIFYYFQILKKRLFIIPLILMSLIIAATHLMLLVQFIIVIGFFYSIKLANRFVKKISPKYTNDVDANELYKSTYIMILLSLFIISVIKFSSSIGNFIRFNEVPLSIFHPFGIISFVLFFLSLFQVSRLFDFKNENNILVTSIILLLTNSFFYFSNFWIFHSKYFSETAMLGIIIWASFTVVWLLKRITPSKKIFLMIGLILMISVSIYPRLLFTDSYSVQTRGQIDYYEDTLSALTNYTPPNSVILANPESIINRYIPSMSNRFIFGARGEISKEKQWVVIPGCHVIGKGNICVERYELATNFYNHPDNISINEITNNYRLDYVLVDQDDANRFKLNFLNLIYENGKFSLYEVEIEN